MAHGVGLIDKFRRGASRSSDIGLDAILDHLDILLNTRQGSVGHLPDFGLPDISEVFQSFPQSIEMLRQAIQATVNKYEPRLSSVQVRLIEHPHDSNERTFRATFQLIGTIEEEDRKTRVRFNTTICETGQASVE